MRVAEVITESAIPAISLQQARDGKMFGPIYHGTGGDLNKIVQTGFDTSRSVPQGISYMNLPTGSSNGYPLDNYGFTGIAAPVHHLGFGTYFTTVKAIAKQFAGGTMRGMKVFFLESQNVEEINFGAPNTMMTWWLKNGYTMTPEATKARDVKAWIAATQNLTNTLAARCDAVWFLGKGIRKLLDGDQICVYRPELIRLVDMSMSAGWDEGAVVTHNQSIPYSAAWMQEHGLRAEPQPNGWTFVTRPWPEPNSETRTTLHQIPPPGMKGKIVSKSPITPEHRQGWIAKTVDPRYHNIIGNNIAVKWQKGGIQHNYYESELDPVVMRESR